MRFMFLTFGAWATEAPSASSNGQTLKLAFAAAFLFGLAGLGLTLFGALRGKLPGLRLGGSASKAGKIASREEALEITEVQLDNELAVILRFMKSYVDANEKYASTLAQAHRNLPSLARPEQVRMMVKFLIAENEKMQQDAADLRRNLEQSRTQIEKLRWNLAEAQELGLRDPLTALGNRRSFDINLAKAVDEAHANNSDLCLVMGDLDRFKAINDAFGHQIGDEILKMFAKLLSSNTKGRDTVARFGGEEFAIILPETKLADAERLAENIRVQLESKDLAVNTSGELIGQVTASFGIAQLEEGDNAGTLVKRADERLYEAKCTGRNRIVIDRPAEAA